MSKIRSISEAVKMKDEYIQKHYDEYVAFIKSHFANYNTDFGHAFKKHYGLSLVKMRSRVISENTYGVSRFIRPKSEIVKIIREALLSKEACGEIMTWLFSEPTIPYDFPIYTDKTIGEGYLKTPYHDWNQGPIKSDIIYVTLMMDYDRADRFHILTAFPYLETSSLFFPAGVFG